MKSELYYYIALVVINILSVVFMLVRNKIKANIKAVKAETENENKHEQIDLAKTAINQFIKDAEQMKNYTGAEKKNYVITRALQIAKDLLTNEQIDCYIEEQVALTKAVNATQK